MIRSTLPDLLISVLRELQESWLSTREGSAAVVCEAVCRFWY